MAQEIANLYLQSNILQTNAYNKYGACNNDNTLFTFTNINLEKVLGAEMFKKYDSFNISLATIANAATTVVYLNNASASFVNVTLEGLEFTSTYNHRLGSNTNRVNLCMYEYPPPASFAQSHMYNYPFKNSSSADFMKPNSIIDFSIRIQNIITDELAFPLSSFPHMTFYFIITGVKLSNFDNTNKQNLTY